MVGEAIRGILDGGARKVIIPGCGTFIRRESGELVFTELLRTDDGRLTAALAASQGIAPEAARKLVEAYAAAMNGTKRFVMISTDKAVNPTNIMGASKKIMEEMIMAYSSRFKISTARFANVAFSNGSLLAGFIGRLMKRQPLSSPNDVKRYFVSPDESGQICMLACILGQNREIFFPKLGAEQMMTFSSIADRFLHSLGSVSYTHLTLPTNSLV